MTATTAAPAHYDRRLTLPLLLGSVLNPVNSSMVAVALVPIGAAFGEPPSRTTWLVTSLYVTTAIGQPLLGRLVDRFGPRRLYLAATALVGIAGMIGLLAQSLDWLIVSRVLLGLGTCSAFPAAMYLIRSEAERTGEEAPTGVLTALSVANQTVAVVGPTLGGLLIGLGSWRLVFGVNVPLSLACLVLGALRLPSTTAVELRDGGQGASVDESGDGRANPVDSRPLRPEGDPVSPADRRNRPPALHRRPALLLTYLRMTLYGVVVYSFLYGFTQWLEDGRGLGATSAGLLLLPMSVTAVAVTALVGRTRVLWWKLVLAAVAFCVAGAAMPLLGSATSVLALGFVTLCVGVGQGTASLANQNAVYLQAPPERMGAAAGFLRTAGYLGAIVSSAAVAAFFGADAGTHGLHELGWFVLGCALALLAVTLLDPSIRRSDQKVSP
ncbi:MFS transporter [Nocardioides mangrovicus]|uniref:MFS transporter n=1 Tax=Nocardioides mangrovicus TaxID=2478913 RepID=A0A3L8P685_9ACTN|nr:MFS transporter [Nocardioides mangrovicus]RLV50213.1 MFS transporter [Nocardioides mangrovicus]